MTDHDARRWNLSPERLYIDCWTRHALREHLTDAPLRRVCNVGIGAGAFDDWLGYWLQDRAAMVSVDIDPDIVEAFTARQRQEAHPNPAHPICADLFGAPPGTFDLVTAVGSTIHETGDPLRAIQALCRWARPGGWVYVAWLHTLGEPPNTLDRLVASRRWAALPSAAFTTFLLQNGAG